MPLFLLKFHNYLDYILRRTDYNDEYLITILLALSLNWRQNPLWLHEFIGMRQHFITISCILGTAAHPHGMPISPKRTTEHPESLTLDKVSGSTWTPYRTLPNTNATPRVIIGSHWHFLPSSTSGWCCLMMKTSDVPFSRAPLLKVAVSTRQAIWVAIPWDWLTFQCATKYFDQRHNAESPPTCTYRFPILLPITAFIAETVSYEKKTIFRNNGASFKNSKSNQLVLKF